MGSAASSCALLVGFVRAVELCLTGLSFSVAGLASTATTELLQALARKASSLVRRRYSLLRGVVLYTETQPLTSGSHMSGQTKKVAETILANIR
jgi:hypothetical protein